MIDIQAAAAYAERFPEAEQEAAWKRVFALGYVPQDPREARAVQMDYDEYEESAGGPGA